MVSYISLSSYILPVQGGSGDRSSHSQRHSTFNINHVVTLPGMCWSSKRRVPMAPTGRLAIWRACSDFLQRLLATASCNDFCSDFLQLSISLPSDNILYFSPSGSCVVTSASHDSPCGSINTSEFSTRNHPISSSPSKSVCNLSERYCVHPSWKLRDRYACLRSRLLAFLFLI